MVSQCANPGCEAQFMYFGEGKLVAVRRPAASLEQARVEFFWLCADCATHWNLEVPPQGTPTIVPRGVPEATMAAH
ncbi:MAG TPA: hypothetical protein VJA94_25660 [Candidatus Angelobacter sp.]